MRKLILLFFCFIHLSVFSQNYTPILDDWNEWHLTNCYFGCLTDVYYTDGDTLVNGKSYKILDGYHYINRNLLLREDVNEKRIYLTITQPQYVEDLLLYDFSLIEGDSIAMRNPLTPFPSYDGYFVLDSIRMLPQNGEEKKHFYFTPTPSNPSTLKRSEWVEGVGSLSMINAPGGEPNFNGAGQLNCAFKNATLFYSNLDSISSCEATNLSVAQEFVPMEKTQLYAQPQRNSFLLSPTNNTREIQLYGMNGKLFKRIQLNNQTSLELNLNDLNSGIYLLKIIQTNYQKQTFKLVVK